MNSLGIYISVPFCRAKCTYCNFASGVSSVGAHEQYVARVCEDIRSLRQRLGGAAIPEQVDSIYLGGGTPSVLSPALVGDLAHTLRQEFDISPAAEITLECAPGQLDDPALDAMLAFGVNRISFGVQSLVDREAAATGRFHTRQVVLSDLERVRAAGLHNLSIDLIAGMPHQTAASWQESLEVLAATGVEHASIYMLEIDEDSRLGRELLAGGSRYHAQAVPSEELTADLYESAIAALEAGGLRQYEISNFARGGSEARHNLKYWRRQPYLGFGLDAHSMVRTADGSALRFSSTPVLAEYLRGDQAQDVRQVTSCEALEEAWFLGLRLRAGVSWQALAADFGSDRVENFVPLVRELCQLGLLTDQEGVVCLTQRGLLFSNDVFARFLGVEEPELQLP
ncbi:MAG TPA: radical SAM family heme chaperone HemW [Acidobacteriaceae bacterium]|nr:radical SAM family heme chaperone HemW [Acidobacteriaceae bacterium]